MTINEYLMSYKHRDYLILNMKRQDDKFKCSENDYVSE